MPTYTVVDDPDNPPPMQHPAITLVDADGGPYNPATSIPPGTYADADQMLSLTDQRFGGVGDARQVTDAITTAGSAVVTSAAADFTVDDVGKSVTVTADQTLATGGTSNGTTTYDFTDIILQSQDQYTPVESATLPLGDYIQTVVSGTRATLVSAATGSATGESVTLKGRMVFPNGGLAWATTVTILAVSGDGTQATLSAPALFSATGATLTIATDNLPAMDALVAAFDPDIGVMIYVPPGEFWTSDSWIIDGERITIMMAAGAHLFSTTNSRTGGLLTLAGHGTTPGAAATPVRTTAHVFGAGKISTGSHRRNENAIGVVRYRRLIVGDTEIDVCGRKAITAQFMPAGAKSSVRGVKIGTAYLRGLSFEDQGGAHHVDITDITIDSAGQEGIDCGAGDVRIHGVTIEQAFATASSTTSGAIHVYSASNPYKVSVDGVRVGEANVGKGAVISSSDSASVRDFTVDHSDGTAVEFYNCTGTTFSDNITALDSPSGVTASGTTATVGRRHFNSDLLKVGQGTYDRGLITNLAIGMTSGVMRGTCFTSQKSELVTRIKIRSGTGVGSGMTLVKAALFSVDASDNLTLIAASSNDLTKMVAASTVYTFTIASSRLTAGSRYCLALLEVGASCTNMVGQTTGPSNVVDSIPRLNVAVTGLADIPSSVDVGSIAGGATVPYFEVLP